MTRKQSVAFNPKCCRKRKTFQGYRHPASHVRCESGSISKTAQDRHAAPLIGNIMCMTYRFVPFPVTLNHLKGRSLVERLFKCNATNICATFRTVFTVPARRVVPRRQLGFLLTTVSGLLAVKALYVK